MDRIFWIGIVIGTLLSFAASIAANLIESRINGFFAKRKSVSQEKMKRRALELHCIIAELHSGKRDRYLYMSRLLAVLVIRSVMVLTFAASAIVIAALVPNAPPPRGGWFWIDPHSYRALGGALAQLFFCNVALYSVYRSGDRYRKIANALDDYEAYLAEFNDRWLPAALAEPPLK